MKYINYSVAGLNVYQSANNGHFVYAASKHALRVFSEGLKCELASKNLPIKVTVSHRNRKYTASE